MNAYQQYVPDSELADSIDPGPYLGVVTKGTEDKLLLTCPDSFVQTIAVKRGIVPTEVWEHMEDGCTPVYFVIGPTESGSTEALCMESAIPRRKDGSNEPLCEENPSRKRGLGEVPSDLKELPQGRKPLLQDEAMTQSPVKEVQRNGLQAAPPASPMQAAPPASPMQAAPPVSPMQAAPPVSPMQATPPSQAPEVAVGDDAPWFVFGECSFIGEQGRRGFDAYRGVVQEIGENHATVISDRVSAMFGCPVRLGKEDARKVKLGEEVDIIICASKDRSIIGKLAPQDGLYSGTIMIIGGDNSGILLSPEAENVAGISPTLSRDDVEAYNLKVGESVQFHLMLEPDRDTELLALVVPWVGRYRGYFGTSNDRPVLYHEGLKLKLGYDLQIEEVPTGAVGDEFEFSLSLNECGFSVARNLQPSGRNFPMKALRQPRMHDSVKLGNQLSLYLLFKGTIESVCGTHAIISSMDLISRTPFKTGSVFAILDAVPPGVSVKADVLFTLFVNGGNKPQAENIVRCIV